MTAPNYTQDTADIDRLLAGIGEALELTPAQRARARSEYEQLGIWLSQPGTELGILDPEVYPQGSSRIGTEVRPLSQAGGDACEHDLDAVAEFGLSQLTAMQQYDALYARLAANYRYRVHLVKKNRCIRIDFPGEFHLDVLPARPDRNRPLTTCVQIPDRERQSWTTSNPKGYATWFEERGVEARMEFEKAWRLHALRKAAAPLPAFPTFSEKPVLTRVVQLIKRRRDMAFQGSPSAPRSIIITTLAARAYDGDVALLPSLVKIVSSVNGAIRAARPRRVEVRNPTDYQENFADAWGTDDIAYQRFADFFETFERDLAALGSVTGLERVVRTLEELFGRSPVGKSYQSFREGMRTAGERGELRVTRGAGLTAGILSGGVAVARSTHFGSDTDTLK